MRIAPNSPTVGAEPTVMLDDVTACIERAEAAGGEVLMPPTEIQGVGVVAFVVDPGGNPIGFMHTDERSGTPRPMAQLRAATTQ